MNKIGIYGDSFANDTHGHDEFPEMKYNAWFYHLGNEYEVTSHAASGSSNYFSYTKFLENHTMYDKNIFLISYPERHPSSEITVKNIPSIKFLGTNPELDSEQYKTLFPTSAAGSQYLIQHSKKYKFDFETTRKLHAIRDYYLWLTHSEYDLAMTKLMIKEIKNIRPDTLFINLFYERYYETPKSSYGLPLVDNITGPAFLEYQDTMIRSMKNINWNTEEFPSNIASKYFEKRCTCHFSAEINLLIAEHIREALVTGIWNPTIPKYIPHKIEQIDYYYNIDQPFNKPNLPGI